MLVTEAEPVPEMMVMGRAEAHVSYAGLVEPRQAEVEQLAGAAQLLLGLASTPK